MKKIFKWIIIVFAGLIGLSALSALVLYSMGMKKLTQSFPHTQVETIDMPVDGDALARGRHIAIIWACTRCHGDDLSGTLITKDPLSGVVPLIGTIVAPNLTSGKGGVAPSYSDMDWVRAIRFGIMPEGRSEVLMFDYSTLSDQDLGNLIAYIKQVQPVDTNNVETRYGLIVPIVSNFGLLTPSAVRTDHSLSRSINVEPSASVEYGEYLAPICTACHGGVVSNMLKNWKKDEFVSTLKNGVMQDGKRFGSTMSSDTFRGMTDMELNALWLYFTRRNP